MLILIDWLPGTLKRHSTHTQKSSQNSMKTYKDKLEAIVKKRKSMDALHYGETVPFAANCSAVLEETPSPSTLQIEGLGNVPFPLSPQSIEGLWKTAHGTPSASGKEKEIDASQVTLSSSFTKAIQEAVPKLAASLKIPDDWKIHAQLHKLVAYDARVNSSPAPASKIPSSSSSKACCATLEVQLPVEGQGGIHGGAIRIAYGSSSRMFHEFCPVPDTQTARDMRDDDMASQIKKATEMAESVHSSLAQLYQESLQAKAHKKSQAPTLKSFLDLRQELESLQEMANTAKAASQFEDEINLQSRTFSCVAYYGDCTRDVTTAMCSGVRVALVYHLVRTTPGPAYTSPHGRMAVDLDDSVRGWATAKKEANGISSKLFIPLRGHYTSYNFVNANIVSADANLVSLFRSCPGLSAHVALVERKVVGKAITQTFRRRRSSYYWDDDSDDYSDLVTMGQVLEEKFALKAWHSSNPKDINYQKLVSVDNFKEEILGTNPFDGHHSPDSENHLYGTGKLEHKYFKAFIVCWPKANTIRMAYLNAGVEAAVLVTKRIVDEEDDKTEQAKDAIERLLSCMETAIPSPIDNKEKKESACSQVFDMVEKFPQFASRWLKLLLPKNGTHSLERGMTSQERAQGLWKLVEKVGWARLGNDVLKLLNDTSSPKNFEHSVSFLRLASKLHDNAFAEMLKVLTVVDNHFCYQKMVFEPRHCLMMALVVPPLSQKAMCNATAAQQLCLFCSANPMPIATVASIPPQVAQERIVSATATLLRDLLQKAYPLDATLLQVVRQKIFAYSAATASAPNQVCVEFLFEAGCFGDLKSVVCSASARDLCVAIQAVKNRLKEKQKTGITEQQFDLYCSFFEQLGQWQNASQGDPSTPQRLKDLLLNAAWSLEVTNYPPQSERLVAGLARFFGTASHDVKQIFLNCLLENKDRLNCLRKKDAFQKIVNDHVEVLKNGPQPKCPPIDCSVPENPHVQAALKSYVANELTASKTPFGTSSSWNQRCLRIMEGSFSNIVQARRALPAINRVLKWRGTATAHGSGRRAYLQIEPSTQLKDLVRQTREFDSKLVTIKKYLPLVAYPVPKKRANDSENQHPNTKKPRDDDLEVEIIENPKRKIEVIELD